MIGVFVIFSLILFMTAIVIFGGNKFFAKEDLIITYFEGSLSGLSVGAAVTYRGVTIGQVKAINIHIQAGDTQNQKLIIPVLISLSAGTTLIVDGPIERNDEDINIFLESMCQRGLRAKLKLKSLVTGKRYIDLAFYENSPAIYRDKAGEYFEIPTLPSDMQQLSKMLEGINLGDLYHKFLNTLTSLEHLSSGLSKSLDQEKTKQLLDNLLLATANLNSILEKIDTGVPPIIEKIDSSLDSFASFSTHADNVVLSLDKQIDPLANKIKSTFDHMDTTLAQVNTLLNQAEKGISPNSPLYYQFTQAMQQLEETASSIKKLSEFIRRNPDTLIFGLQNPGKAEHNN